MLVRTHTPAAFAVDPSFTDEELAALSGIVPGEFPLAGVMLNTPSGGEVYAQYIRSPETGRPLGWCRRDDLDPRTGEPWVICGTCGDDRRFCAEV